LDKNFNLNIDDRFPNHSFGWTLALGTASIQIMDLANAYATLSNGTYQEICPILEIKNHRGEVLKNPCEDVLKKNYKKTTAFFISDILSRKNIRPYSWNYHLSVKNANNVAVKTGTSTKRVDNKLYPVDNIVVGYTPDTTMLMWAGNTDGRKLKAYRVALRTIGKIWSTAMEKTLATRPSKKHAIFKVPEKIQKINGEWATLDYKHPGYDVLSHFVYKNAERGTNPLNKLQHKRYW